MSDNGEPAIDLDALQAQVNMAMAETEELVSSWVRPSKRASKRPKQSLEEVEKELQEYMRRPPRLGVGAPIPEAMGPNVREDAKLKDKLMGHDKKRRRDSESTRKEENEEDEEEMRKGKTDLKRVRLDPFGGSKKKAKQKEVKEKPKTEVEATLNGKHDPSSSTVLPNDREVQMNSTFPPLNPATQEKSETHKPPISQSTPDDPFTISTKKKKKKKSHDTAETTSADGVSGTSGRDTNVDIPNTKTSIVNITDDANIGEEEWTGFGDLEIESVDFQLQSDVSKTTLNGTPLLNLNGPPPSDGDDVTQSPTSTKKKRRRRKKNKSEEVENVL